MKCFSLALFIVLILSGCTGDLIYVDGRFTPSEQQSIAQAADMWETASNGQRMFNLVYGAHVDVYDSKNAIVRTGERVAMNRFRDEEMYANSLAITHRKQNPLDATITVVMMDRMPDPVKHPDAMRTVVAHELGHVMGLGHSPVESALMYHDLNEQYDKCVSRADLTLAGVTEGKGCDENQ